MKKMLVKAVALSLVLGGVGFVANNAQAFSPIEEIQLKSKVDANHERSMNRTTKQQFKLSKLMLLPIKETSNKMQKISLITKLLL